MSNTSLTLVNLDFQSLKESFKQYLANSQPLFKDYDFDGSNISVLLDVLAYNTSMNAFYLNMLASEMFMDSSQLRDSVVSHAKLLNYTPRSFISSKAIVDIIIKSGDNTPATFTIPKGTTFTGKAGSNNYNYVTQENIIALPANSSALIASNCTIYEGSYISENFVYTSNVSTYELSNPNIDISSLVLVVVEDGGIILPYIRKQSLFGLQSNSQIYFLQGARDEKYEISFGDGVIGRKPKDNATIIAEYRICNGELPDGVSKFSINGAIGGFTDVDVNTVYASSGGAVSETIDSIKFNAPRFYGTQERAVTVADYENLLKLQYPEINDVIAYGGEELSPPQYGRVFVSVDLKATDGLPDIKKRNYYDFLKSRSPLSIEPVVVSPDYMYLVVNTVVRYNPNVTVLNESDIKSLVISKIQQFNDTSINKFGAKFRYSKFVNAIDQTDSSIISNDTVVKAMRIAVTPIGAPINLIVDFQQELGHDFTDAEKYNVISSTSFFTKNISMTIQDDGEGYLYLVPVGDKLDKSIERRVGTVDYKNGIVTIQQLNVQSIQGTPIIKFFAKTKQKDITSSRNTILGVNFDDVQVTAIKQSE